MMWLLALACALSAGAHLHFVVPRLQEPVTTGDDPPPHYAQRGSMGNVVPLVLVVFILAQVVHLVPTPHFGMWFGYLGAGAALVWVDATTTWLPRTLNAICLAQVIVGLAWVAVGDWPTALAAVVGGALSYALFHLVWRFTTTFGFGDVRLTAIVGTMGALNGPDGWVLSMFCGTLIGAVWAIIHAMTRRRRNAPGYFAYGPALWLGPIVATTLSGW